MSNGVFDQRDQDLFDSHEVDTDVRRQGWVNIHHTLQSFASHMTIKLRETIFDVRLQSLCGWRQREFLGINQRQIREHLDDLQ